VDLDPPCGLTHHIQDRYLCVAAGASTGVLTALELVTCSTPELTPRWAINRTA
jgi:hypothetical protein